MKAADFLRRPMDGLVAAVGPCRWHQAQVLAAVTARLQPSTVRRLWSGEHTPEDLVTALAPDWTGSRLVVLELRAPIKDEWAALLMRLKADDAVVVQAETLSRATRLGRDLAARATWVECALLPVEAVPSWISGRVRQRGTKVMMGVERALAAIFGAQLLGIEAALDQLEIYAEDEPLTVEMVNTVVGGSTQGSPRIWLDAVLSGRRPEALRALAAALSADLHPRVLMAWLTTELKHVWRAVSLRGEGVPAASWAAAVGVPPFVAGAFIQRVQQFDEARCRQILTALTEADVKAAEVSPDTALQLLTIKLTAVR